MPDAPRPRIGVVLAADAATARRGLAAFERVRRDVGADLVLLVGGDVPGVEAVGTTAALRDALERARERRAPGCALGQVAEPRDLVRQGVVDAVVTLASPPAAPRLRLRRGVRVVDLAPGERASLADRLDPAAVATTVEQAARALRGVGLARPRLVALTTDGDAREAARLDAAIAHARQRQEIVGPQPEAAAMLDRGDAVVTALEAHAELLLALLGAGPTTTLLLEPGLRLACAEPDEAALRAAVEHLGGWSRAEGELVAARAPVVNVHRAQAAHAGRCPFCRRALDESPSGELLPPGAPLLCVKCGTSHHRDCLAEHGRCTLLGCDATRVVRLGVTLPIAGLGPEAPTRHPFRDVGGAGSDAGSLRVEAPIDDPQARVERRRVALELGAPSFRRGELVEGFVAVSTARPLRARGGLLRLRATLTTRDHADPGTPARVHAILEREAALVGDRPSGALGRLHDGVASWFGTSGGLVIPTGCRRWPFSFRLPPDHPGSVTNRRGSLEELVTTTLEVVLDTDAAAVTLDVR